MTDQPAFALIGRAYPSDNFELLYRASKAARAAKRSMPPLHLSERRWRYRGEPITLPLRLPN